MRKSSIEMRPPRVGTTTAVIGFLLLWGFLACGEHDPLQQEIVRLQDRIMPSGAMIVKKANIVRNGNTASSSWEYETDWDWEKYATWVSGNLATDYKPMPGENRKLHFRRSLPGDVFEIQIERNMSNAVRKIRVQFRALPD